MWIYANLGEIDRAFDSWENAVAESDAWCLVSHGNPAFELLHSHPRFAALLRKMNLEP